MKRRNDVIAKAVPYFLQGKQMVKIYEKMGAKNRKRPPEKKKKIPPRSKRSRQLPFQGV